MLLKFQPFSVHGPVESAFERQTLALCERWMQGTESWSFQTSGSTGAPKHLVFSRAQILASARASIAALGFKPGQLALLNLPLEYIAGFMSLIRAIEAGMQVWVVEPKENLWPQLQDLPQKLDAASLVPNQWLHFLAKADHLNQIFSEQAQILLGGAALSPAQDLAARALPFQVWATYGMTETLSHIALRSLAPNHQAAFQALDQVQLDQDERQALRILAPQTQGQWIQTEDKVQLLDAQHFIYEGRLNRTINSAGFKIQPERLERLAMAYLEQQGLDCPVLVLGVPDQQYGERPVLLIESAENPALAQALSSQMKQALPEKACPDRYLFLPVFPQLPNGKWDLQALNSMISRL